MNIVDLLCARAREMPDAPAVLTPAGILSFEALERAVRWTAATYRDAGLAPGDHVAVAIPDGVGHLVAALALARIGVGHLALRDSDTAERQQDYVRRLGLVAAIARHGADDATGLARIDPPPGRLGDLKNLSAPEVEIPRGGDWPCHLMATSGTTGAPKLMSLSHSRAIARLAGRTHGLPTGAGCTSLSLTHIAFNGAKQILLAHLLAGSCVAFPGPLSSPEEVAERLNAWRISFVAGAPVWALRLLEIARAGELLLPHVRAFQVSSTVVAESLRENIRRRLTPNLHIAYGSGEVGMIASATPALLAGDSPGSVGAPAPGNRVAVVDDDGAVVPVGVPGRLRVRSAGLVTGYLDDPAETARAFRDGWHLTGDRVALTPRGTLVHLGRADDTIVYDGVNISPAEIENVLLKHPAVTDAVALPIRFKVRGHVPVAAVTLRSAASEQELLAHCRAGLRNRAPVAILALTAFPRTENGKVRRQALAQTVRRKFLDRAKRGALASP